MRIEIVDPAGTGLGVAIGMAELGHAVRYVPAEPWPDDPPDPVAPLVAELLQRYCGGPAPRLGPEPDLRILWDGFADGLRALTGGAQTGCRFDPEQPWRRTLNPLVYPARLQAWFDLVARGTPTAAVDFSDVTGPREEGFAALPHVACFAREVPRTELGGRWRPLPFLYNPVLLWLDLLQPRASWCVPSARRRRLFDWVFCGSVTPRRYRGRRAQLLAEVRRRWPRLRGGVLREGSSFREALAALNAAGAGLDLPGVGELCFRMHEALALDVPVFRPWPFTIALPSAIEAAILRDVDGTVAAVPGTWRRLYEEHYAPRVAASTLLAGVAAQARAPTAVAVGPTGAPFGPVPGPAPAPAVGFD